MLVVSVFLRLIFTAILVLHIPFYFFTCKDGLLTIVDESIRGTIANRFELGQSDDKEKSKMSYHDMNDILYYFTVTFLIFTITVASIKF